MNVFAEHAKRYAEAGLYVFPVVARGKTPLVPGGANAGSVDPAQLDEWVEVYGPDANIGIDCGHSGLVVLDVDVKKGGLDSLKTLALAEPAIYEAMQKTRVTKTGTGGFHYWFKARPGVTIKNSASKDTLGSGLDIRTVGGQVVAPPSINADGNPYTYYRNVKLADVPQVPMELVARLQVEKWGLSEKLTNSPVMEGGRNDYLMRAGCSMRAKGFEHDEIEAALIAMNMGRCHPALDVDEVTQIVGSICKYERGEQLETALKQMRYQAQVKSDVKKGRRKLEILSYDKVVRENLNWLWFGRIAYGKVTLLAGVQGKTKSYLTLAIAAHVSRGEALPGDYVNLNPEPHDVLLVTYEDGEGDTIKPRLEKCGADLTRIWTLKMDKSEFSTEDIPALLDLLEAHPSIKLIVIDPVQNMMVDVNSGSDEGVRQALQPLVRMANQRKVAVLGIKHFNKSESLSIDSRIGSSVAYQGIARSILVAGHDNTKVPGPQGETFAGMCVIKGNLAGLTHGVLYEVNDRGLFFLGEDPLLTRDTVDRLLPKKQKKEKD